MPNSHDPTAEVQEQFSSPGASPTPWTEATGVLDKASVYWISTVRPDGRPHVTPLFAVWLDGALYFCTGASERKAKNLAENANCIITTGCNTNEGLDLVVEGSAVIVDDEAKLHAVADKYAQKYNWKYMVRDGAFYGDGGRAEVYMVAPAKAFAFGKGDVSSQTRYRFQPQKG